jgi:hypothetical protein
LKLQRGHVIRWTWILLAVATVGVIFWGAALREERIAFARSLNVSQSLLQSLRENHFEQEPESPDIWVFVRPRSNICHKDCSDYIKKLAELRVRILRDQFSTAGEQANESAVAFVLLLGSASGFADSSIGDWRIVGEKDADHTLASQIIADELVEDGRDLLVVDGKGRMMATAEVATALEDGHLQMALSKTLWANVLNQGLSDLKNSSNTEGAVAIARERLREMVTGKAVKQ